MSMFTSMVDCEAHVSFDPQPHLVNTEAHLTTALVAASVYVEAVSDTHVRMQVQQFWSPGPDDNLEAWELEEPVELTVPLRCVVGMQLLSEPGEGDDEDEGDEDA